MENVKGSQEDCLAETAVTEKQIIVATESKEDWKIKRIGADETDLNMNPVLMSDAANGDSSFNFPKQKTGGPEVWKKTMQT